MHAPMRAEIARSPFSSGFVGHGAYVGLSDSEPISPVRSLAFVEDGPTNYDSDLPLWLVWIISSQRSFETEQFELIEVSFGN